MKVTLQTLSAPLLALMVLAGCQHAPSRPQGNPPATPDWLQRQRLPRHLPNPVDGFAARQLRDTWGDARSGGRRHLGIDLKAPVGTAVRATTDGVVMRTSTRGAGGHAVWLLGPAGSVHYYAHLLEVPGLQVGQRINRGQQMGRVGQSGNATTPHLHYGIQVDGQRWVNPYDFLR